MNLPTGANGDHFVNAVSGEVVKIQVNDARVVGHVHLGLKTTACRVREVNAQLVVRRSITDHIVVVVAVEIATMIRVALVHVVCQPVMVRPEAVSYEATLNAAATVEGADAVLPLMVAVRESMAKSVLLS